MKISREEMYRRVWEKPVTHIAKELDISDVGLAKACRKHAIPLPPVGYWTKLKHGKLSVKPPLPKLDTWGEIEIDARRFRVPLSNRSPTDQPLLVVVSNPALTAEKLAPSAAATRQNLLSMKPDGDGILHCSAPDFFECRLSIGAVQAAITLLNAIETTLPQVGGKLVKGAKGLEVELNGQRVSFRLIEQYSRVTDVVPEKSPIGWARKEYIYTFTGKLSLEITGYFEGRKKWADGIRESLSEKLGEFVRGLVDAAQAMTQRALELEARSLKWAEEARLREAHARELRLLEDFKQKLLAEAQASSDSQMMLAYLHRIKEHLSSSDANLEQPANNWLQLASRIATQMNPENRRVQRLMVGAALDPYSGYFGQTLI